MASVHLSPNISVREVFREQITRIGESETPVGVTRRGETLGVYVLKPRKARQVESSELRDAADRLGAALSDTDEEEIVAELKRVWHQREAAARYPCFGREHPHPRDLGKACPAIA